MYVPFCSRAINTLEIRTCTLAIPIMLNARTNSIAGRSIGDPEFRSRVQRSHQKQRERSKREEKSEKKIEHYITDLSYTICTFLVKFATRHIFLNALLSKYVPFREKIKTWIGAKPRPVIDLYESITWRRVENARRSFSVSAMDGSECRNEIEMKRPRSHAIIIANRPTWRSVVSISDRLELTCSLRILLKHITIRKWYRDVRSAQPLARRLAKSRRASWNEFLKCLLLFS